MPEKHETRPEKAEPKRDELAEDAKQAGMTRDELAKLREDVHRMWSADPYVPETR